MALLYEYRWAAGWITKAALEGSDSYGLENFGIAWDQPSLITVPWLALSDEGTTYPDARAYELNADGSTSPNGDIIFTWSWGYATEGMIQYIKTTMFSGQQNAQTTVKTRIKSAASAPAIFAVYQAYMTLPPENESTRQQGGAMDYNINFYSCSLLT